LVGWDKTRISKIETGRLPLTLSAIAQIAPALGEELATLLYTCLVRRYPHLPNTLPGKSLRNVVGINQHDS
jgi:hypothetical protein